MLVERGAESYSARIERSPDNGLRIVRRREISRRACQISTGTEGIEIKRNTLSTLSLRSGCDLKTCHGIGYWRPSTASCQHVRHRALSSRTIVGCVYQTPRKGGSPNVRPNITPDKSSGRRVIVPRPVKEARINSPRSPPCLPSLPLNQGFDVHRYI